MEPDMVAIAQFVILAAWYLVPQLAVLPWWLVWSPTLLVALNALVNALYEATRPKF